MKGTVTVDHRGPEGALCTAATHVSLAASNRAEPKRDSKGPWEEVFSLVPGAHYTRDPYVIINLDCLLVLCEPKQAVSSVGEWEYHFCLPTQ